MAVDRYERPVKVGDQVHLTYGGDHHMGTVEAVHDPQSENMGPSMVHVTITALVPAAALVVEKGRAPSPKKEEEPAPAVAGSKSEDTFKKAEERAAHRVAAHRATAQKKGGR